jgi:hypothetical protein
MGYIEITGREEEVTRQQRWSHLLTVMVSVMVFLYGVNLRANTLNATAVYTNIPVGINAQYPANWLLDEDGDYIFRVRDVARIGYKTNIIMTVRPVSPDMTERNVLDTFNITRPQTLATYRPMTIQLYTLPDESPGMAMNYTFVEVETNPFLDSVPIVVSGLDIITIKGGQAIIITFRADSLTYNEDIAIFNHFLNMIEF